MAIFTHVVIGTKDLQAARTFYDRVLEPLSVAEHHSMRSHTARL
jgi:catechol 2,3-dioxygenase-like lactoylglutathione lyase family enzyme